MQYQQKNAEIPPKTGKSGRFSLFEKIAKSDFTGQPCALIASDSSLSWAIPLGVASARKSLELLSYSIQPNPIGRLGGS